MKRFSFSIFLLSVLLNAFAQKPASMSSADILQQMKKLEVFGSVLYIAAHPDDENTRLLAYLANEKRYRTGYLSLTRGDGGQNLIGDEQGIDLGLIRTQELLAARRIDGAEQFFSRAYDFGYSKSPEEAMKIWNHDKILSDVVWVIRNFKPDVIITRFPTTGEGGHGHHTASAILAGEAFDAAADPTKFPEQLKEGVGVWQAKRLLWNTFNFGVTNTTRDDQFKLDCGAYNPIIGKSYGEMAAESRSQHKSQGFGVPAQRGTSYEFFSTIKGEQPVNSLMDGIDTSSRRLSFLDAKQVKNYNQAVNDLITGFDPSVPKKSLPALEKLYKEIYRSKEEPLMMKKELLKKIMEGCAGLFMEATAVTQLNVIGDSMKINLQFNNRSGAPVSAAQVSLFGKMYQFNTVKENDNANLSVTVKLDDKEAATQPYWLEQPIDGGAFNVSNQQLIGKPEVYKYNALFQVTYNDLVYTFSKPIMYKYTDPVKAELYEPIQVVHPAFINNSPSLIIFPNEGKQQHSLQYTIQANRPFNEKASFYNNSEAHHQLVFDSLLQLNRNDKKIFDVTLNSDSFKNNTTTFVGGELEAKSLFENEYYSLNKISYDHIPDIYYNYYDRARVIKMDLKIAGKLAGYIAGAGDRVPEALQQMGYSVVMLTEKDITTDNLARFDVVIAGVRAYNIHSWLGTVYPVLMQYVRDGGVLLAQYNTSNSIGPVKAKISPYPFSISRNRITDETATVNFLLPDHPALNFPNKITQKDFDGWIQERSIYNAESIDPAYQRILSMKDPGENSQDGSLIISNYGKGRFVYTGLVFFRELPAGIPGAYRLFANLIANKR